MQQTVGGNEQYLFDNVGFMLYPAASAGGEPFTLSHLLVYMISSQSERPDIAFQILTLASAPDLIAQYSVDSAHLAVRRAATEEPVYQDDAFLQAVSYMLGYTTFGPNHGQEDVYKTKLYVAISAVKTGSMTPDMAQDWLEAELVVEYNQGPITGASLNIGYHPEYIIGPPDVVLDPCCTGLLPLGTGGSITVEFTDNSIANGPGPDLSIIGDPQSNEHIQVEVSADGTDWKDLGIVPEMATLDLQDVGLEFAKYVRITDDAVAEANDNSSAEVDAVEALHSGPPQ
jgi:hypothetical protein